MNNPEIPKDFANALAYQAAKDFPDAEVQEGEYRCAMCGEIFTSEWSDKEAQIEAVQHGFDLTACMVVCDDCYKLTPWGNN